MNPNVVFIWVYDLHDFVGEGFVGGDVGEPVGPVEPRVLGGGHGKHVVEQRPEIVLAETVVELVLDVVRQESRDAIEFLEEVSGDVVLVGGVDDDVVF